MATRNVKRLHDLEIDEISLVDRGANQHATVAIAKRAESDNMTVFDNEGVEVFEDELEHGDIVYGEDGQEFVFVDEDEDDGTSAAQDQYYEQDAAEQGYEPELVGKAFPSLASLKEGVKEYRQAGSMSDRFKRASSNAPARARRFGGRDAGINRAQAGGGLALAGAGGYGVAKKSLGDSVLETLSKALRDGDQGEALGQLVEYVEVVKAESDYNAQLLAEVIEAQQLGQYTELAQGYGVPADPERLGHIMKSLGQVLSDEDFAEVHRVLSGAGEIYSELGSGGSDYTSDVMGQVEALAGQAVGKSDLSHEQAVVALFEANPAAYDEYVAETR